MKEINIVYQPGFGGHFLTYLFSLDPSTVPHMARTDNVNERLQRYDFKNTKKFHHWSHFHTINRNRIYKSKEHQTLINCIHPDRSMIYNPEIIYYIVDLSYDNFSNYWLVSTKEKFGNFPVLFTGDFDIEIEFRKKHQPIPISMDSFLDNTIWQDEYVKISKSMGVPLQLEAAQKLYQSWYDLRVAPIKNEFEKLTKNQTQETYLIKRKQDEKQEPDRHFWNSGLKH